MKPSTNENLEKLYQLTIEEEKIKGDDKTGASKEIIYISKGWAEAPGKN